MSKNKILILHSIDDVNLVVNLFDAVLPPISQQLLNPYTQRGDVSTSCLFLEVVSIEGSRGVLLIREPPIIDATYPEPCLQVQICERILACTSEVHQDLCP